MPWPKTIIVSDAPTTIHGYQRSRRDGAIGEAVIARFPWRRGPASVGEIEAEAVAVAAYVTAVRRGEVRRQHQRGRVGDALEHPPPRLGRVLGKFAEAAVPVRLVDLHRVMHDVAGDTAGFAFRRQPPGPVATGCARPREQ